MNETARPDDGHEEISFNTVQYLTFKDGQLYWKKQKVITETRQRLALTALQRTGAFLLVVAALAAPSVTYMAEFENICRNTKNRTPFCPPEKSTTAQKDDKKLPPVVQPLPPPSPPVAQKPEPPLIAYVVFFAHGSASIEASQLTALKRFFQPLALCAGLDVRARGLASSAPYGDGNDSRNIALSARRVEEVVRVGASAGVHVSKAPFWASPKEMDAERGFQDSDERQGRLLEREPFNRRVELRVVSYGECKTASSR